MLGRIIIIQIIITKDYYKIQQCDFFCFKRMYRPDIFFEQQKQETFLVSASFASYVLLPLEDQVWVASGGVVHKNQRGLAGEVLHMHAQRFLRCRPPFAYMQNETHVFSGLSKVIQGIRSKLNVSPRLCLFLGAFTLPLPQLHLHTCVYEILHLGCFVYNKIASFVNKCQVRETPWGRSPP